MRLKKRSGLCVYCGLNPPSNTEHVFPKGLGGGPNRLDCVCEDCNNFFSSLERELIQKSFVDFMRMVKGIRGYKRGKRVAPLRSGHAFYHDAVKHIVFEVGVESRIRPYFRPQIIKVKDGFVPAASSLEESKAFEDRFQRWLTENREVAISFPRESGCMYRIAKLTVAGDESSWTQCQRQKRGRVIAFRMFKGSGDLERDFQPRVFMDDDKRLFVRARDPQEVLKFLQNLVDHIRRGGRIASEETGSRRIEVMDSRSFDFEKANRALTKIALNCLLRAFPGVATDSALALPKRYVLKGGPFTGQFEDRDEAIDKAPGVHQVIFLSDKRGVGVRITLFEFWPYQFSIPGLVLPTDTKMTVVLVDYKSGEMKIMGDSEFASWKCEVLSSRDSI